MTDRRPSAEELYRRGSEETPPADAEIADVIETALNGALDRSSLLAAARAVRRLLLPQHGVTA